MIDLLTKGNRGFVLRNSLGLLAILLFEVVNTFASGAEPRHNPYPIYVGFYAWMVFHNRVLVDRLFQRRRLVLYFVALTIGLMGITWLQAYYIQAFDRLTLTQLGCWVLNYTLFGTTFYYAYRYLIEKREWYQVNLFKKEVELNQLKAQLHPHFLFNSLNNIYSYNLENHSQGNDLILKLAQLMRYLVEVNTREKAKLSEEIQFITNYVDLEKERLSYRSDISFEVSAIEPDTEITPLLFFPLIENAFKHGGATNRRSTIDIRLSMRHHTLVVVVTNSLPDVPSDCSTQTGLSNVRRRLQLLYPEKHDLRIQETENQFEATLTLLLA